MKLKFRLLTSAALVAGAMTALPALAQTNHESSADKTADKKSETIVVTGVRESLGSALATKKASGEIVDSIVAEDIGKLPDKTVADALQRISGVQIAHDFGEGGNAQNPAFQGVTIRGLNQVEYTLNGQEVLTAAGIRYYNVQDMPSELVKAVNVYKTASPNLTEGGLGGLINIETFKPFDFAGFKLAADAHGDYSGLAEKVKPSGSILISNRWQTGIGEVGVLVDLSYQSRALREDYANVGSPIPNTDAIPGSTIYTPNGTYVPAFSGKRRREGLSAAIQWRPSDSLEFFATANDNRFKTFQNQATYSAALFGENPYSIPGTFTLTPGTDYAATGSYGPIPSAAYLGFTSIMGARDSTETNQDYTVGGTWRPTSEFTLKGSADRQRSTYLLDVAYGYLVADGETWSFDLTGAAPANTFTGPDLTDFSNYSLTQSLYGGAANQAIYYVQQDYTSNNTAGKLDAQWEHQLGPISAFNFGFRYSDHEAVFNQTQPYSVYDPNNDPSDNADLYQLVNTHNFEGTINQLTQFWVFNPDILRANFANESAIYGGSTLPTFNPYYKNTLSERTTAGYVEAKLDIGKLDGNVGVRFVNTDRTATGTLTCTTCTPVYSPVSYHTSHTDILPSGNLRYKFTDEVQARFSASKTLTRPNFSAMNPNTTLNPGSLAAYKGNVDLPSMYSTNFDISLEYYFGKGNVVYADGFKKIVRNFPYTSTYPEDFGGVTYTVTESLASSEKGSIKGFEVGYSQFYDFLPGLLRGLGMQANYTFVDSQAPFYIGSALATSTTLPYLSRHSVNVIGMYELNPVSVRVAYTWRSSFLQALYTGTGTGNVPIRQAGYGWLDASVNYDITSQITGYIQATNLLDTLQKTYTNFTYSPGSYNVTGREFVFGIRFKL